MFDRRPDRFKVGDRVFTWFKLLTTGERNSGIVIVVYVIIFLYSSNNYIHVF